MCIIFKSNMQFNHLSKFNTRSVFRKKVAQDKNKYLEMVFTPIKKALMAVKRRDGIIFVSQMLYLCNYMCTVCAYCSYLYGFRSEGAGGIPLVPP